MLFVNWCVSENMIALGGLGSKFPSFHFLPSGRGGKEGKMMFSAVDPFDSMEDGFLVSQQKF